MGMGPSGEETPPAARRPAPDAGEALLPPRPALPAPTALSAAGVLCFVLAAALAGLAAVRLVSARGRGGVWDLAFGILFAVAGYGIIRRERRGYIWGLGGAIAAIVVAAISPALSTVLIPLFVIAGVLLWTQRRAFGR